MNWPTPQDYNEAIQNPQSAFADAELRTGQPMLDALDLPRPITGQFASVYKMECGAHSWAVRCFLRNVSGQQSRYEAISAHLAKTALPYFVGFEYLPQGIRVRGQRYPILKMAWVQGDSLAAWVAKNLSQPAALAQLANRWAEMMGDLQRAGIAHGDLQHGNVLIVNGELRLVDYDGMFVPVLAGQPSQELGHRHYQHPTRSATDFDVDTDNFSAWVIYLSLMALSAEPALWQRFDGGDECLLFRRADFEHPDQSKLMMALTELHGDRLQKSLYGFRRMLSLDIDDIPPLELQTRLTPTSFIQWIGDYLRPGSNVSAPTATAPVAAAPVAPAISPITTPSGMAPTPAWIADYAPVANRASTPISPVARQSAPPPQSVSVQGSAPVYFQHSPLPARVASYGTGGLLVALMTFAATSSLAMPTIGVAVTSVLVLNLFFLLWQFWRDPAVRARDQIEVKADTYQRKILSLELRAGQQRRKRDTAAHKHESRLAEVDAKRTRVHDEEQSRLIELNQAHQTQMAPLLKDQQQLRQQEADARRAVQGIFGPRLAALQLELKHLAQSEKAETAKRLSEQQDQFVQNALHKFGLVDANVPTLDRLQRMRLVVAGVVSAADVDPQAAAVRGMEPARKAALLAWRQALEANARLVAPKTLIPKEAEQIRKQFDRRRQELEKQRREVEADQQKQEQAVPGQFTRRLSGLDVRIGALRAQHDQNTSQVRTRATDEIRKLDAQLFDPQRGTQPRLQLLEAELTAVQRELDQWHEQRRQSQEQLDTTFHDVQFATWVQWVLGLKRRP